MNELDVARKEINEVDLEMAKLFERRMKACEKVAAYKMEHGLSIKDIAREEALIEKCRKTIEDPDIEGYYVQFLKSTIDLSCKYQEKIISGLKVAYCGVEGAYANIAAKQMFPTASLSNYDGFAETYHAVEAGDVDCAVLPLENSYAGEVSTVMDLLFSGSLYVNQVIDLPIKHCLIANPGATLDSIETVVSHPQALQQCNGYIRKHGYETLDFSNTAVAAEHIKEVGGTNIAAIASEETAELFGLEIIESGINDASNNTTRFASLSRVQNNPNSSVSRGNESFILVFTTQNKAGALAQTLNIIGAHGYNMKSLRSRPMKELQWNYYFYIEAEGEINNENGRTMLQELSALCARLKLVGTYVS